MKTYPTNVRILVADDVREEVGGKQTIVGLYSGDDLHFERPPGAPKEARPAVSQLCIYAILSGGEGDYNITISLVAPSGAVVTAAGPFVGKKLPGKNLSINCRLIPVQFSENGIHKVRLSLDENAYELPFTVSEKAPAGAA